MSKHDTTLSANIQILNEFDRPLKAEYDKRVSWQYACTRKVDGCRVRHHMASGCRMVPVFITDMPEKLPAVKVAAVMA